MTVPVPRSPAPPSVRSRGQWAIALAQRPRSSPEVLSRPVRLASHGAGTGAETGTGGADEPPSAAPAKDPPAPEGVTGREWEVARLVAEGLSTQEIGERLFMSVATVKTHLGRLYHKLQVTHRVQLAIRVLELNG